ncbi:Oligo-1,6-glucosidase 1 [Marinomonas spartinae]|uniref:Oligo-1,6-glucosidase 1 n=1 Tax=Marinomonas spartinae TaxID=1792290 RepID=A0A1A8TUY4_9GAMM|nr:alpha-amylase family glycosyl hydrolase [Marinomonas spartinae]SBS37471.1 Oligo-1,6-glucosidase 1 [Marinomonas spartinae]SBS37490.1 Oligo-1,6-glucosidase 1 [Marinomonas spartinae]
MENKIEWWRGAVIYQIYPRSFFDANNDGIGDLLGITQKMDYIASLGVDAIWLSPFFTSPMKDFGYDVSDYCDVDPIFGTLKDFDDLVAEAHKHGLKVMIDQVLNHTSDQHPWFKESRKSHDNDKADWYVWADAKPDGTVPNNWLSVFGGPAWHWDSRRKQYYLHNFLDSQPDLNFHNPDVVDAILATVEFWLKRGVDGFRLDTANYYYHDLELRDNPAKEEVVEGSIGVRLDNPYAYQQHLYDKSRPENIAFLQRLRALLDQYPQTTTVGEVGCDFSLKTMAAYTQGHDKLHMCYSFDLLTHDSSMEHIRHTMETIEAGLGDGWPCWSIGNHDVERVATRWGKNKHMPNQSKAYMAMLLSLRGSVCLYQGEELGLPEAELSYEQLVDPYGINFWPEFKGRDGCRTPMPWSNTSLGGFTTNPTPWLPVMEDHLPLAVEEQEGTRSSILYAYRDFLHLRRSHPELIHGDIEFLYHDVSTLTFLRSYNGKSLYIAINTAEQSKIVSCHFSLTPLVLPEAIPAGYIENGQIVLPAFSVFIGCVIDTE